MSNHDDVTPPDVQDTFCAAQALLFENVLPGGRRANELGEVTLDGEVINPLPAIAAEMAELHGVRAEGE